MKIKKIITILLITFILLTSISNHVIAIDNQENNNKEKEWTYMIYGNQKTFCFYQPFTMNFLLNNAKSGKNLNLVVLQDRLFFPARMWSVNQFGIRKNHRFLGETNLGESETLEDFINYCKENYPAKRYALEIWGHGMGWIGAGWDQVSDADVLEINEVKTAIKNAGGVDILTFTTNCWIANLEVAYELKDAVDVIVSSQENNGWNPLVLPKICKLLDEKSTLSNIDIGNEIINIVGESEEKKASFIYPRSSMSAVRTDKLDELVLNINQLSELLIENINQSFKQIKSAFKDSLVFWIFMDLTDFVKRLYNESDLHEDIKDSLRNTWDTLNETIINNFHSSSFPNAYGLTINALSMGAYYHAARLNAMINLIYGRKKVYDKYGEGPNFYHQSGLDFVKDSKWDEFLKAYDDCHVKVGEDKTKDYSSIQEAIDNAEDYDLIYVSEGIYYENIVITKPITLIGDFQGKSIIDGQKKGDVITINSDNVKICDFTIINSSDDKAGIRITGDGTKIFYCDIKDNGYGIYFKNAYNSERIACNNFSNNHHYGVYLESSEYNAIFFNLFTNNTKDSGFINSGGNIWDNRYSNNIDKRFHMIYGKNNNGRFSFTKIDIDYPNIMWHLFRFRLNAYYYIKNIIIRQHFAVNPQ